MPKTSGREHTAHLDYLLEAEAELADFLVDGALSAHAADRPAYRTNYIGSKQKRRHPYR